MYRVLSGENVLHVIVGLQFSAPRCNHFGTLRAEATFSWYELACEK